MLYDVEFQVHEIGIWFRVNDVHATNEDEAITLAEIKLKNNTGIELEFSGHQYHVEIVNTQEVD